jgi:hypothetical protein
MKTYLHIFLFLLLSPLFFYGQITTPIIKARFGVDGDVKANYFNSAVQTGNDDWYNLEDTLLFSGKSVIDTTGAAAIVAGYVSDVSPWPKRNVSFYRGMSRPAFSVVNSRLWLDALFVRDYHGTDQTVFTSGSDKNGMSPVDWTGGTQSIPDKNDILDVFMHVRRAGPNTTDSLWMFGGLSLDQTSGNRYFDFEMYQTDIYFDRVSGKWFGYGPDAGHTSWKFDASGNILSPGDIIFSAEYQSSTLTKIEARIWVSRADWETVTPTSFNWSGQFDGATNGAAYGYASILPNNANTGNFYTGMVSPNNTWAGPFGLVLQDNSLAYTNPGPASTTNSKYVQDQFMEFSVNLSKLGLDPAGMIGGDICGTPFNRIVIKTRASASFTAELKDFVAPTDLFLAPRVLADTETPYLCDTGGIAEVRVTNPIATSFYQWSSPDGNIVGTTTGPVIYVDTPGTYIVTQYLQAGCSVYAIDTVEVLAFSPCGVLAFGLSDLRAVSRDGNVQLSWKMTNNQFAQYFEVERSLDGINFTTIGRVDKQLSHDATTMIYTFQENTEGITGITVYYRVKLVTTASTVKYSNTITFNGGKIKNNNLIIFPNPARDFIQLQVVSATNTKLKVDIYDPSGRLITSSSASLQTGTNVITLDDLINKPRGIYLAVVSVGDELFRQKIVLAK